MSFVRDDGRVSLSAQVGGLVDPWCVVVESVTHPDDHAGGEGEVSGVEIRLAPAFGRIGQKGTKKRCGDAERTAA